MTTYYITLINNTLTGPMHLAFTVIAPDEATARQVAETEGYSVKSVTTARRGGSVLTKEITK